MWIVKLALSRPYTFVVVALLLLIIGPLVIFRTPTDIWPDKADLEDAVRRVSRFMGRPAPPPRRFAKYPLENKLYHGAIVVAGLSAILTGVLMMFRVRTIFFPRNPYLFSDMTWGMMYVLHGFAGVGSSRW